MGAWCGLRCAVMEHGAKKVWLEGDAKEPYLAFSLIGLYVTDHMPNELRSAPFVTMERIEMSRIRKARQAFSSPKKVEECLFTNRTSIFLEQMRHANVALVMSTTSWAIDCWITSVEHTNRHLSLISADRTAHSPRTSCSWQDVKIQDNPINNPEWNVLLRNHAMGGWRKYRLDSLPKKL